MNVKTQFGIAKDIYVDYWEGDGTYLLADVDNPEDTEDEFTILGVDTPIEGDNEWRFWIGKGIEDGNGVREYIPAELSKKDEQRLIDYIEDFLDEGN